MAGCLHNSTASEAVLFYLAKKWVSLRGILMPLSTTLLADASSRFGRGVAGRLRFAFPVAYRLRE
jgi:hypothetical protein